MFDMMIDAGPKDPSPVHDFKVKVTYLEFLCLRFYNVCFCEAFHGLIHVWHGDRNWSKILYGTIPDPVHDL